MGRMKENLVSQKRSTCCGVPISAAASEMVRKASGPFTDGPGSTVVRVVHARLHHVGGAKADHAARIDGGGFAGLGVAAHAGALGPHLEDAEARELDHLPLLQGLGD